MFTNDVFLRSEIEYRVQRNRRAYAASRRGGSVTVWARRLAAADAPTRRLND